MLAVLGPSSEPAHWHWQGTIIIVVPIIGTTKCVVGPIHIERSWGSSPTLAYSWICFSKVLSWIYQPWLYLYLRAGYASCQSEVKSSYVYTISSPPLQTNYFFFLTHQESIALCSCNCLLYHYWFYFLTCGKRVINVKTMQNQFWNKKIPINLYQWHLIVYE